MLLSQDRHGGRWCARPRCTRALEIDRGEPNGGAVSGGDGRQCAARLDHRARSCSAAQAWRAEGRRRRRRQGRTVGLGGPSRSGSAVPASRVDRKRRRPSSAHCARRLYAIGLLMVSLSNWTSLVATARGALWLSAGRRDRAADGPDAALRAAEACRWSCHAPATAARLGLDDLPARDLLELYRLRAAGDASACRRRAASAEALDCGADEPKKSSPPCRRSRPRCSTSSRTWRRWPRPR